MADDNLERSEPPIAPPSDDADSQNEGSPPADDSYLIGATGVEEQVLAELARAEASINDPEEATDDTEGAVV